MSTCKDCRYYLPVDVFRGLCKKNKKNILPDDPFCDHSEKMPKCKFCAHFSPEKEFLGKCMATTLAYPDMPAAKCADFKWINQN